MTEPDVTEIRRPGPRRSGWIRLFGMRGVPIYVHPLLIVLLGVLVFVVDDPDGMISRFALVGILLGSVFLHEVGHAWAAKRRDLRVSGVYLHLLPFAYVEQGAPRDELAVALAGPATSLFVAAMLWIPLGITNGLPGTTWDAWFESALAIAFAVNALMGAVNLVPALPLDGGRALRAALTLSRPEPEARLLASRVGMVVGGAVIAVAVTRLRVPESLYFGALGAYLCVVAWRERRG